MKDLAVILIFLGAFALIVFAPFATVWALNTLFSGLGLNIPYTFETWCAVLILSLIHI